MDYDIIFIDKKIKQQLQNKQKLITKKISKTKNKSKIDKLKENLYNYEFYSIQTMDIIKEYNSLLTQPTNISFVNNNNDSIAKENKIKEYRKTQLIINFLKIAREYIDIDIKYPKQIEIQTNKCKFCNCDDISNITDTIYVCINCGMETTILPIILSYKDIDRINISTKYKYDKEGHFRGVIQKYQGYQNNNVSQEIYDKIIKQLKSHRLVYDIDDHILIKNSTKKLKYKNVTKSHIFMFLKELGYIEFYNDCTFIYCNITGDTPPNISHLVEYIMDDFKLLVKTYNRLFNNNNIQTNTKNRSNITKKGKVLNKNKKPRKNFLNSQYVLFQLLRRRKHKCKKEDFNILKTRDRRIEHDEIYSKLCNELKWTFIPTT